MATVVDYDRLRRNLSIDDTVLSDIEAADIYAEAATLYTGAASLRAGAHVIAIMRLLTAAAKLTDYSQDTTQESEGQVFDHLKKLLDFWQAVLDKAIVDEAAAGVRSQAQSLRVKVIPSW